MRKNFLGLLIVLNLASINVKAQTNVPDFGAMMEQQVKVITSRNPWNNNDILFKPSTEAPTFKQLWGSGSSNTPIPNYCPTVPPASSQSPTPQNNNSVGTSPSRPQCRLCLGSGKCSNCNGTGWVTRMGMGHSGYCPVCPNHNGRCTNCGGTGRM